MKKTLILISALVLMYSCGPEKKRPKAPEDLRLELDTATIYRDQNYQIYTLDGCEYIAVGYGNGRWGSHKGNCKNPIHESSAIDTTEKHFDCIVELCEREGNQYAITTECGILFYADKRYSKGDILKGFVSPKHK
jgi:hypothetical protein